MSERGNVNIIVVILMIIMAITLGLSQLLLSNKYSESIIVRRTLDTTYEISSVLDIVKSSTIKEIKNKEIYWDWGEMSGVYFVNLDFNSPFFNSDDLTKIINRVVKYSEDRIYNVTVYIDGLSPLKIGDYCYEIEDGINCDGFMEISMDLYVNQKDRVVKYLFVVSNIGVKENNDERRIYLDLDSIRLKFKELGD